MKIELLREMIWRQFGAAIDMFDDVLALCPDELWQTQMWTVPDWPADKQPQFWSVATHALFWLDLYLYGAVEGFEPQPPLSLSELDPSGAMPERVYTQPELRAALARSRANCHDILSGLTEESAMRIHRFGKREFTYVELLIYTMRHVQEHTGQLSLILGRNGIHHPTGWVSFARE